MLQKYLVKQLGKASYKLLKDGTYFGEIRGLRGVWANAKTLEQCRTELQEVLESWFLLKVRDREHIPGFRIALDRRALVRNA